jgi:cell division protein ZapA
MANRVTMNICGQDYTLIAEESPSYMERVGSLVNAQLSQIMENSNASRTDAAILADINIADELLKSQESAENLRRQLKTYLDEAAQAKNEVSELKRQLFKAQNRK